MSIDFKTRKFCNELHYAVKGHLINESYSDEEVQKIGHSYLSRLWGNHERLTYCSEDFELLWEKRYMNKCKTCGHDCHCSSPDCKDCVNDVCTSCSCKEKEDT